jgi:hypothetical protein
MELVGFAWITETRYHQTGIFSAPFFIFVYRFIYQNTQAVLSAPFAADLTGVFAFWRQAACFDLGAQDIGDRYEVPTEVIA